MTATATAPAATVEVGDFFVCSWGYDQTNIDYYKVVGITPSGKSVKVQQWSTAIAPGYTGHEPCTYKVPGEGPHRVRVWNDDYSDQITTDAPVEMHRIKAGWSKPAFTVNSFSVATHWDGEPEYATGAGWGR